MIKGIIFDLGNVLIDFDHRIAARRISRFTDKRDEDIYNLFFDSGLTALFEEGKITPQGFFLEVKKMLGLAIDYEAFLPIWNEIFFISDKNKAVYNLAKDLMSHYAVALLSNINRLHFEYLKNRYAIFDAFRYIVTSYEAGCRKPDPQIYTMTLRLLGITAQECFYTDDRPGLVEGALKLGINAFVFSSAEKLKENLLEAGVGVYA
ncbi:MAG: HAD family phosphatase [Candidatus Omnitrophota bacterium]